MSIKILTQNAIDVTNIDGARENHFSAGMRSGIVKGAFNEGTLFTPANNIIALDTCELRISGHRVIIDSAETITFVNRPSINTMYSLIAEINVNDGTPNFRLFYQSPNIQLIKDNLFKNEIGDGTYQIELGTFTLNTDGTLSNIVRTIDVITGSVSTENNFENLTLQYDLVIKTQKDFEDFYNSLDNSNCNASSVLFVGDGGDLEFTRNDGKGITIPSTLSIIDGINNAVLRFDNLTTTRAIYYAPINDSFTYRTSNIVIRGTTSNRNASAIVGGCNMFNCVSEIFGASKQFNHCLNLTNCYAKTNDIQDMVHGFHGCENLINCKSYIESLDAEGYTFCKKMLNCKVVGTGGNFGFYDCEDLVNCVGNELSSIEFGLCTRLVNCYSNKQKGTFNGCSYMSNCEDVNNVKKNCTFVSATQEDINNAILSLQQNN